MRSTRLCRRQRAIAISVDLKACALPAVDAWIKMCDGNRP
jgi:hypothetical protein